MGIIIVDTVFFQATGDAVPKSESGCLGKPRGPVEPKNVVVIKRKLNPQIRKRLINFVFEMFIYKLYQALTQIGCNKGLTKTSTSAASPC